MKYCTNKREIEIPTFLIIFSERLFLVSKKDLKGFCQVASGTDVSISFISSFSSQHLTVPVQAPSVGIMTISTPTCSGLFAALAA